MAHTLDDYRKLAEERQMVYTGNNAPSNTLERVEWRCARCGRTHFKSYHSVRYHNPCRCRTKHSLQPADYHKLARQHGILWIGAADPFLPKTSKTPTRWKTQGGEVFEATYHSLAYNMTRRLEAIIYGEQESA